MQTHQPQIPLSHCNWLEPEGVATVHPTWELDGSELEGGVGQAVFLFLVYLLEAGLKVAAVDADVSVLNARAYFSTQEEVELVLVLTQRLHTGFEHITVFPFAAIDAAAGNRHNLLELARFGIEQEDVILIHWRISRIEQSFGKGVDHTSPVLLVAIERPLHLAEILRHLPDGCIVAKIAREYPQAFAVWVSIIFFHRPIKIVQCFNPYIFSIGIIKIVQKFLLFNRIPQYKFIFARIRFHNYSITIPLC